MSFPNDGVRWSVLTARTPWFGMIAVREKDDIYVRTFKGDHIADVLAAALGERVWKADEQPIKVTRGELIAANEDIVGLTPPSPHARRALRLMDLDTYLIAEFYAEHHHRGETRKRTQIPLRVYGFGDERYDAGCWTLRATIRGKDEDLHLAPADTGDVAQRIEELRRVLD